MYTGDKFFYSLKIKYLNYYLIIYAKINYKIIYMNMNYLKKVI